MAELLRQMKVGAIPIGDCDETITGSIGQVSYVARQQCVGSVWRRHITVTATDATDLRLVEQLEQFVWLEAAPPTTYPLGWTVLLWRSV